MKQKELPQIDKLMFAIEIMMSQGMAPSFHDIRKHHKLSLRFVEVETGISNAYLSQMENGLIKNPSFSIVMKLYNFYKTKYMNHVETVNPNLNPLPRT